MNELLAKAARNRGLITIRHPMGKAGAQYRQREQQVQRLVEDGLADWANPSRTLARLTRDGWRTANGLRASEIEAPGRMTDRFHDDR